MRPLTKQNNNKNKNIMVENQKVITVVYELYVDGEKEGTEELMERATTEHPLIYCHGENMMLPMFEANLAGKNEGDHFDFRIPFEQAYGEYDETGVLTLDKEMFEIDGKFDTERVFVGNVVPMTTTDGQIVNAQVVEITDKAVTIDLNHPLAGENLHFVGQIIGIRDAQEEELKAIRSEGCHCGCHHDSCEDCHHDCSDHCCE